MLGSRCVCRNCCVPQRTVRANCAVPARLLITWSSRAIRCTVCSYNKLITSHQLHSLELVLSMQDASRCRLSGAVACADVYTWSRRRAVIISCHKPTQERLIKIHQVHRFCVTICILVHQSPSKSTQERGIRQGGAFGSSRPNRNRA